MSSNNMLLEDNNTTIFSNSFSYCQYDKHCFHQSTTTRYLSELDHMWRLLGLSEKKLHITYEFNSTAGGLLPPFAKLSLLLPNYLCKYVVVIVVLCLACALFVTNTSVRPGMCFELPTPVAAQSTLRYVTLSEFFKGDTLVCM